MDDNEFKDTGRLPPAGLGATGRYPQGKLNEDDEGELQFGIARDGSKIVFNFGKSVHWIAMDTALAKQIAALLMKHVDDIERDRGNRTP